MRDHAQRHRCVSFSDEAQYMLARDEAVGQRARCLPGIGPITFHKWISEIDLEIVREDLPVGIRTHIPHSKTSASILTAKVTSNMAWSALGGRPVRLRS